MKSLSVLMNYKHNNKNFDKLFLIEGYGYNNILIADAYNNLIKKVDNGHDLWVALKEIEESEN